MITLRSRPADSPRHNEKPARRKPVNTMKYILLYLFCFLLPFPAAQAAISDMPQQATIAAQTTTEDSPDTEFNMFLFAIVSTTAVLVLAGLVIVSIAVALLLALITAGVASVSVIAGLHQRSLKAGVRFFFLSMTGLSGTAGGMGIFFLINRITHGYSTGLMLLLGALLGTAAGWLCGRFALYALGKLTAYVQLRRKHP